MRTLWRFLQQEQNRQLLGWLGGGVVVLAGGLWAVVTFFSPLDPHPQPPNINVQGGVATGRDISRSTITVHPSAPGPPGEPRQR